MSAIERCPLDETVASVFPLQLDGFVVALRACIDAGTQGDIFCVAAVAYGYDRAVKASRDVERLMMGRTFHMTDVHNRKEEFEGISDAEAHNITVGMVDAVRENASYVVAVACDAALVADMLPNAAAKHPDFESLLAAFRSTYGFMCHLAMTALGTRASALGKSKARQISYVFEQGDDGQKGLRRYLEYLSDDPHHRLLLDSYSYGRSTVTPKEGLEAVFHSADFVAWEWARHVNRHKSGSSMRRSLSALTGQTEVIPNGSGITLRDDNRFFLKYLSVEQLAAPAAFFRESLVSTRDEEVLEAFSRYRAVHPAKRD
jgi:hypothetical protein